MKLEVFDGPHPAGNAGTHIHLLSPVDLDRALATLEDVDPPLAALVELRYFGGYTDAEAAQALGISERTVRRQWDKARAFLLLELAPE